MKSRESKNFFLALAGGSVSELGTLIYGFAMGLYVLQLTGSGQSFSITLMLSILPRVLLGPFTGALADRWNKKVMVVVSDLVSAGIMVFLFLISRSAELNLAAIYGASFLLSLANTFLMSSFGAAAIEIISKDNLTRFNGINQSLRSFAGILAPALGGIAFSIMPISFFILANGISFFVSAVSECFIDFKLYPAPERRNASSSILTDMKDGFSYLGRHRLIMRVAIMALVLNFFMISSMVVIPFAVVTLRGIPEQLYGVSGSITLLGSVVGALVVARMNLRFSNGLLVKAFAAMAGAFLLYAAVFNPLFSPVWFVVGGAAFIGFCLMFSASFINIPVGVFLQTNVEQDYLGRVLSIITSLSMGITPLAFLFFGWLTELLSPMIILGGSGIIISLVVTVFAMNSKSEPSGKPVATAQNGELKTEQAY